MVKFLSKFNYEHSLKDVYLGTTGVWLQIFSWNELFLIKKSYFPHLEEKKARLKQYENIFYFNTRFDEANNMSLPLQEALKDDTRIEYHHKHLLALLSAIRSDISS